MAGKHIKINIGGKIYEGTLNETPSRSGGVYPEWMHTIVKIVMSLIIVGAFIAVAIVPLFTPMRLNNAVKKFDIEVVNAPKVELDESWETKINCSFDVVITNNSKYSADNLTGIMIIKNSDGVILYENELCFIGAGIQKKSQSNYLVDITMNYSEETESLSINNFEGVEIWFEITEISFKEGKTDLKKTESVLIKKYD